MAAAEHITPISEVDLHFAGGSTITHMVPTLDLSAFVEASKRLHHSPGINPHNGGETAKVWKITSRPMRIDGPYWWSTPDLGDNGNPAGARILRWGATDVLFIDEDAPDAQWTTDDLAA